MKCGFPLIVLVLAACGNHGVETDPLPNESRATTSTAALTRATEALRGEARSAWAFRFEAKGAENAKLHMPRHVSGRSAALVTEDVSPYVATLAFLTHFQDIFAIDTPAEHLSTKHVARDALGMTHLRLQQFERGIPVQGAEMMAHYDARGSLRILDSTYAYDLDRLDVEPTLGASDAERIAEHDFKALVGVSTAEIDTKPELVIHVPRDGEGGSPVLVYHLDFRTPEDPGVWMDYVVDAKTGAVVRKYNKVMSLTGSGKDLLGLDKTFEITKTDDHFSLVDTTRSAGGIATYDAKNRGQLLGGIYVGGSANLPGDLITAPSEIGPWDPAAIDANVHAGITYDFYKKSFNRKGILDDDGKIVSTVHVLQKWCNAQWAQYDGKQMLYGDGDGTHWLPFSADLSVVAHELTHGVTFNTSNLNYIGETGALNESISDIFGSLVHYSYFHDDAQSWMLGAGLLSVLHRGKTLRNIAHPHDALSPQPAHMSEYKQPLDGINTFLDLGGVHTNSGIPNNAFYLMTAGGTNDVSKIEVKSGIGRLKAAQIWYRTNVHYLTSTSGFAAAADANLAAANDLGFTENQKNIIECAWIAVGVKKGTCKDITPEQPDPEPARDAGAPDPSGNEGETPGSAGENAGTNAADGGVGSTNEATANDASSGCSVTAGAHGRHDGDASTIRLVAVAATIMAARRKKDRS